VIFTDTFGSYFIPSWIVDETRLVADRKLLQREQEYRADPAGWAMPEPRLIGDLSARLRCGCYLCGFDCATTLRGIPNPIREYGRHYYREHAYRNWSA
jgi:hypothetical protein